MKVELEFIRGVEGHCVSLNNYRIAGPKPSEQSKEKEPEPPRDTMPLG